VLTVPKIDPEQDLLSAALAYAEAGWYVLPIDQRTKHAGSVLGKGWPSRSSRDPETIVSWFAGTPHGLAVHVGRSEAVVFDVDTPEKLPGVLAAAIVDSLPPYQSTRREQPARGHYVFACPPGRVLGNGAGKLGKAWGEVRGRNGIVVVSPTTHEKVDQGGQYVWERTGSVPVLPGHVADLLPESSPAEGAATDRELRAFLEAHTASERPQMFAGILAQTEAALMAGESRHETFLLAAVNAMTEAAAGFYSARQVAADLRECFVAMMLTSRDGQERVIGEAAARAEFAGILAWGVSQAALTDPEATRKAAAERLGDDGGISELAGVEPEPPPPQIEPADIGHAHQVFRRWLGAEYDLDVLDAVLCALTVEQLDGDPLWLLVISGPGAAKTETVQACVGAGAFAVSTVSGEAALLSGTPRRDRARNATGGLLRRIGDRGVLVIKDVTSILSMSRDKRAEVLAAIREIYDGRWSRNIGADGGRSLEWGGRIALIGAVTTAWDTAHAVIATMGDRFVIVRLDSRQGRIAAYRRTLANTGDEIAMRAEMAEAVGRVVAGIDHSVDLTLEDDALHRIGAAADLVTRARTAVERDYQGNVIDAHAPEMPTRFARQLQQIVRGGLALGMKRDRALQLAIRCARDSMPPLRLEIVDDLAEHPLSRVGEIRRRLNRPRRTVDRECEALHMLSVLDCDEEAELISTGGSRSIWRYSLASGIDPTSLKTVPEMAHPLSVLSVEGKDQHVDNSNGEVSLYGGSAKSGTVSVQDTTGWTAEQIAEALRQSVGGHG
jgi:hypothetical protein